MIVTLISEPRTGSNSLVRWFKNTNLFDVLILPSFNESTYYQKNKTPKEYEYEKQHLIIKEELHTGLTNLDELLSISNFVIFLYRENFKEQLESWVIANRTKNWHKKWVYNHEKFSLSDDEFTFFENIKNDFNRKFLNNEKNFIISYEELYYNNGIERIKSYVKIPELYDSMFPVNEKYRIDIDKRNII